MGSGAGRPSSELTFVFCPLTLPLSSYNLCVKFVSNNVASGVGKVCVTHAVSDQLYAQA